MKITIAYTQDEERSACLAVRLLLRIFPAIRVHKSEHHPPYKHIYMTTKKAGRAAGERETD